jgi:hypothetical protein
MKPALCSCVAWAEFSICVLVSTLGIRPRRQKCGGAQLFCAVCIQRLLAEQWMECAGAVQQSLTSAYTAIKGDNTAPI